VHNPTAILTLLIASITWTANSRYCEELSSQIIKLIDESIPTDKNGIYLKINESANTRNIAIKILSSLQLVSIPRNSIGYYYIAAKTERIIEATLKRKATVSRSLLSVEASKANKRQNLFIQD
jgi:hypothetical protein